MNKLLPNDIGLLTKIFFPACVPQNLEADSESSPPVVIVHGAGSDPDGTLFDLAEGIIDITGRLRLPDYHSQAFHIVKNPDNSIRWLCPVEATRPVFLKLYNGSGWRGRMFRNLFRASYALGLKGMVSAGCIRVFSKEKLLYDALLERTETSEYAIFTGTVGENRKAVVALAGLGQDSWFFKLPLTDKAEALVKQEELALRVLGSFSFDKMTIPTAVPLGPGVLLTDVKPALPLPSMQLQPIHLDALDELYRITYHSMRLDNLASWKEITQDLETIQNLPVHNNLEVSSVTALQNLLPALAGSFRPENYLPTAIAHGDFTPWNMYPSAERLHLYDWELASRQPALFDAFHFIFQSGILIERLPFEEIWQRVEALKGQPMVQSILKEKKVCFETLYGFYLLKNVSYYLARYMQQHPLHEQANWLAATWAEALTHYLKLFVKMQNDRTAAPSGRFA